MRSVEEMQAGLRSAMNEIQSIRDDLEQFKNAKVSGELTADFKQISANAKRYPVSPHPLSDTDEHTQKLYLTLLLSVAAYEPERLSDSLNFIHRIAYGCGYLEKGDLKEEFTSAQILTFDQLDEATGLFRENDLRLMLVEEMLITAGAFNKGRGVAFEYISNLCRLLNISKDETAFLSNMAAAVLTKDASKYKCKITNKYDIFNVYLSEIEFPFSIYSVEIAGEAPSGSANISIGLSNKERPSRFKEIYFSLNDNTLIAELSYTSATMFFGKQALTSDQREHKYTNKTQITDIIFLISEYFNLDLIDSKLQEQKINEYSFLGSFIVPIGVRTSPLFPENYPPALDYFNKNNKIQYLEKPQNPLISTK